MKTATCTVAVLVAAMASACSGTQTPCPSQSPPSAPDAGVAVALADAPDAAPVGEAAAVARVERGALVLEGTPAIPAELSHRLSQYLGTRGTGFNDISADGKRLLVTTRFGDTNQVHLLTAPMGTRRQLTFASEPAGGASFVPRDPRAILYSADVGGNEKDQIYRLDLASGRAAMLTDGKSRHGRPLWSHDGKQIAYRNNGRSPVDFDIWVSDASAPASARRLVEVAGMFEPLDWSYDKRKLLVGEYLSANVSRVHIVDVGTGTMTPLTAAEPAASYPAARFSRSGKQVYITGDHAGEFTELYEVDLGKGSWRPLTRDIPWDVSAFTLSADGKTLAYVTNEDGYSVLRLLDTASRKSKKVTGVPRGVIGGIAFASKAKVIGFSLRTATHSSDVYTYDVVRRKLTRWTESEMGGLAGASFTQPELIRYRTFDGAEIPAFYYRPAGAGPFPAVIYIHGGPEGQATPRFSALTQYLVGEEKIAVVYPNVRGSRGYGKTYLALDNGFKREDSVKDIGALLDWVAARPELDGSKIAVLGGSYGGYMVLAALVHFGERIVAGIDVVGISNFVTFLENTGEYRRDLRRVEYGDERDPAMRAHLEKISPLTNVGKIRSALFVAQGANDPRVPASEAEQVVAAVRKTGHNVWYMLAKNEGHGFARKENRDVYMSLAVLFLKTHLQGNRTED